MGWAGLSIAELCRTILDPAKNGSRSVAELITHMTTDKQGAVGLAAGSRAVSSTSFQGRSEDCPRSLGHGGRAMSEVKELDMLQGSSSVTPSGLSRRDVLKGLGAGTAVLVAGRLGTEELFAQSALARGTAINAWVAIAADGRVTLQCAHSEMGQGIVTTFGAIIADELEADWSRCEVVFLAGSACLSPPNL
jgi:hypothetical protein